MIVIQQLHMSFERQKIGKEGKYTSTLSIAQMAAQLHSRVSGYIQILGILVAFSNLPTSGRHMIKWTLINQIIINIPKFQL